MLSLLRRLSTWRYPLPAFAAERRRLQLSIRYVFKWSSWVVPINAQQIQDGGRPPFWKPLNRHISAIVWPIFDEIWHGDAYWLLTAERAVKFRIFWKSKTAAASILKITKIAISPQRFDRFFAKFGVLMQKASLNRCNRWKIRYLSISVADAVFQQQACQSPLLLSVEETDKRTPGRYIDPPPHTTPAASVIWAITEEMLVIGMGVSNSNGNDTTTSFFLLADPGAHKNL